MLHPSFLSTSFGSCLTMQRSNPGRIIHAGCQPCAHVAVAWLSFRETSNERQGHPFATLGKVSQLEPSTPYGAQEPFASPPSHTPSNFEALRHTCLATSRQFVGSRSSTARVARRAHHRVDRDCSYEIIQPASSLIVLLPSWAFRNRSCRVSPVVRLDKPDRRRWLYDHP